ncbi:MAG: hypothetical protein WBW61_02710 [Rhodanobacteraceae bacterium]
MTILRMRLTGDTTDVDRAIHALHGLDEIERLEQVDELVPRMRDDSSSEGLVDDTGSGVHCIEIEVANENLGRRVQRFAETAAQRAGVALEFVERF